MQILYKDTFFYTKKRHPIGQRNIYFIRNHLFDH
jgi:hypothetical protein